MKIQVELQGVEEVRQLLSDKQLTRGIASCLNRAVRSGRTELSTQLRQRWNIQKSEIDRKIAITPAAANTLTANITITGDPISLMYFNPTMSDSGIRMFTKKNKGLMPGLLQKQTKSKNSLMTVKILQGQTTQLKQSFFIIGKGGTPLVVRRIGSGKGKLQARKTITIASMALQSKVLEPVKIKIIEQFNKEWDNQVRQINNGQAGWLQS